MNQNIEEHTNDEESLFSSYNSIFESDKKTKTKKTEKFVVYQ